MNLTPSVQHGHPAKHNLTVARVKLETLVTIESFPSDMDCAARFYTTKEGLHSCRNYTSKQEFQSVEGKKIISREQLSGEPGCAELYTSFLSPQPALRH